MDNATQSAAILRHLQEGKTLTPLEALNMFGCLRLGARVWDLKKQGYTIITTMKSVGRKKVAEYSMEIPA